MQDSYDPELLSKTFWNNVTELAFRGVWKFRKVHSGIRFFHVATAIVATVKLRDVKKITSLHEIRNQNNNFVA